MFWCSMLILELVCTCNEALEWQELEQKFSFDDRLKNWPKYHSIIQLNESQPNDFSPSWNFHSDDFFNHLKSNRLNLRKYQLFSQCQSIEFSSGWKVSTEWNFLSEILVQIFIWLKSTFSVCQPEIIQLTFKCVATHMKVTFIQLNYFSWLLPSSNRKKNYYFNIKLSDY